MGEKNIGKLKSYTKKRCPECGKILQIRVRAVSGFFNGLPLDFEEEYIACSNPNCWYEEEIEQKRRRIDEKDIMPKKPKRDYRR
jgi:ssDNA-binding Zn-finger/Zn-ribbon topoisomerase 1